MKHLIELIIFSKKNSNTVEALTEIENTSGDILKGSFNPNDLRDLQVLLDQPQKHVTPFETYISYQITTKVQIKIGKYDNVGYKLFLFNLLDQQS